MGTWKPAPGLGLFEVFGNVAGETPVHLGYQTAPDPDTAMTFFEAAINYSAPGYPHDRHYVMAYAYEVTDDPEPDEDEYRYRYGADF